MCFCDGPDMVVFLGGRQRLPEIQHLLEGILDDSDFSVKSEMKGVNG